MIRSNRIETVEHSQYRKRQFAVALIGQTILQSMTCMASIWIYHSVWMPQEAHQSYTVGYGKGYWAAHGIYAPKTNDKNAN